MKFTIIHKYQPGCALCGEIGDLLDVDGVLIFRACAEKIRRAAG